MKSVFRLVIQVHDMQEYPCTLKLSDAVTIQPWVRYAHTGMRSDHAVSDIVLHAHCVMFLQQIPGWFQDLPLTQYIHSI